jgi:hypothetical protein
MTRLTARPRNDRGGLIPPGEMFDRPLSDVLILDTDLPFEERVARAWTRLKATRFLEEEHKRLRDVLAELIWAEICSVQVEGCEMRMSQAEVKEVK